MSVGLPVQHTVAGWLPGRDDVTTACFEGVIIRVCQGLHPDVFPSFRQCKSEQRQTTSARTHATKQPQAEVRMHPSTGCGRKQRGSGCILCQSDLQPHCDNSARGCDGATRCSLYAKHIATVLVSDCILKCSITA